MTLFSITSVLRVYGFHQVLDLLPGSNSTAVPHPASSCRTPAPWITQALVQDNDGEQLGVPDSDLQTAVERLYKPSRYVKTRWY